MKNFENKLKEILNEIDNGDLKPIEWRHFNTGESEDKGYVIVETTFKYKMPSPKRLQELLDKRYFN